jgi:hypothetical protein
MTFVEKNKLKDTRSNTQDNPFAGEKKYDTGKDKNFAYIILALIVVIAAIAAIFLFISKPEFLYKPKNPDNNPNKNGQTGYLPGQTGTTSLNGFNNDGSRENLQAELIGFGDYYKEPVVDELSAYSGYDLPLDIKNDVRNYFYITRKFNLDNYIKELNQNGFVVIDNPFSTQANDFYSLYRLLAQKEMPSVLSSDLILYYFQNELKNVYQEIEKNVFYDNLWKVYKEIYDVALARYKNRVSELGVANDTILEAQRQEVSYLAVMLYILKPTETQVSKQGSLLDSNKFNETEAFEYNFTMPDDIKLDAEKEINYLRESARTLKSPTFLRQIDYRNYRIPEHYTGNAKLNNFYLAIKWLQTPWPLYYQSEECPDCELDYRDWLINMSAAGYLANDLGYDQDLKNRWATIYKFVAYFTGLEKDLTYLDYLSAYREVFGDNYNIEVIFSDNNEDRQTQTDLIQEKLANISLKSLHGGKKRDQSEYRLIGMRLLQDFYWPNNYLLNELVGREFTADNDKLPLVISQRFACPGKTIKDSYRCHGTGFDVVNILKDYETLPKKYAYNNEFANYQNKILELKSDLSHFNNYQWHESVYWTTLNIISQYLDYDNKLYPSYNLSPAWHVERDINTVLGAWVNLHTPADIIEYKTEQKLETFNMGAGCDQYNTIEVRPDLINILISKTDMLIDILADLGVTKKTSVAAIQLREMSSALFSLKDIMLKVQSKENLDADDCKTLKNFSNQYQLLNTAKKNFTINFKDNYRLNASNNGNKLMLLIYEAQGDTVIGFSPIFNYQETY